MGRSPTCCSLGGFVGLVAWRRFSFFGLRFWRALFNLRLWFNNRLAWRGFLWLVLSSVALNLSGFLRFHILRSSLCILILDNQLRLVVALRAH